MNLVMDCDMNDYKTLKCHPCPFCHSRPALREESQRDKLQQEFRKLYHGVSIYFIRNY